VPAGRGKGSARSEKHAIQGGLRWVCSGGSTAAGGQTGRRASSTGSPPLSTRGVSPDYLVALEVRGRHSGRIIRFPLVMAVLGGERYLVSMLGQSANWVRNVRAAGGDATLRHGRREEVHLVELVVDRRAPVLKAYLKRATNASAHMPIPKDAPLAEFERLPPSFPVFRIVPTSNA
jgi:hypothetical protein